MSAPRTGIGTVEPLLQAEFPGLELRWCRVATRPGRSEPAVRERLRALSNRYMGARVVAMRTQPIAHAYRAFYRQVGLDPDVTRVPSEEAAIARLLHGGFRPENRLADARLIALVETGVPVWALDAGRAQPALLGIRTSGADERLDDLPLGSGRLVVADARTLHGILFGPVAGESAPGPETREVLLFSVGVDGVPSIYLEEALWMCADVLEEDG